MDTQHDLVPLDLAARTVYQRVYEQAHRKVGVACNAEHLNGIAYAIAALSALFSYEVDGASAPRSLKTDELLNGLFRDGGRSIIFLDGRPALTRLAVLASELYRVVHALSEQGSTA